MRNTYLPVVLICMFSCLVSVTAAVSRHRQKAAVATAASIEAVQQKVVMIRWLLAASGMALLAAAALLLRLH